MYAMNIIHAMNIILGEKFGKYYLVFFHGVC